MTPLWEELEAVADRLAVAGSVKLPDLRTMRAAAVQMGNWFEGNTELREENERLQADCIKYRTALNQIHEALGIVKNHAMLEGSELSPDTFARDFAPFQNIMAIQHKIEPYYKPKRARKIKESKAPV